MMEAPCLYVVLSKWTHILLLVTVNTQILWIVRFKIVTFDCFISVTVAQQLRRRGPVEPTKKMPPPLPQATATCLRRYNERRQEARRENTLRCRRGACTTWRLHQLSTGPWAQAIPQKAFHRLQRGRGAKQVRSSTEQNTVFKNLRIWI